MFCFVEGSTEIAESLKSVCLGPFFFSMIMKVPSEKILRAGKILRNTILSRAPHMIRDRKYHLKTYRCVSWLYRGLNFYAYHPLICDLCLIMVAGLKRSEIILWCCLSLGVMQSLMGLVNLVWSNLTGNWVRDCGQSIHIQKLFQS